MESFYIDNDGTYHEKSAEIPTLANILFFLFACSKQQEEPSTIQSAELDFALFQTHSAEEFYQTTSIFGSSLNVDASAVLVSSDQSGILTLIKCLLMAK
ncbi:hypothetical protein [Thalassotalea atypica]|uniref:hypothetical protein n=1 Tax=Thalassotalea atypica TaxID=2054316 RepID=UPI00257230B9|nr:hypothetical protein [Thalassotalea atypica]